MSTGTILVNKAAFTEKQLWKVLAYARYYGARRFRTSMYAPWLWTFGFQTKEIADDFYRNVNALIDER